MSQVEMGICPKCKEEHPYSAYCGGTYRFHCPTCDVLYYGELMFKTSFISREKCFIGDKALHQRYGSVITEI